MQNPGFNVKCNSGNEARWGYCVNCANENCQLATGNDADAAIGIGLRGEGRYSGYSAMGAGWTAYFASGTGTCSANGGKFKRAWISVANGNRTGK